MEIIMFALTWPSDLDSFAPLLGEFIASIY